MNKYIVLLLLTLTLTGCGKDYVTSMDISDTEIVMETDDIDYVEVTVKAEGKGSTEITAVSSDENLIQLDVYPDEDEPGLNYVDFESFESTGEAEVMISTVGTDKDKQVLSKTVKVSVVKALEDEL